MQPTKMSASYSSQPYLKTDRNVIIRERSIIWAKQMNECLEVCVKSDGCTSGINTHKICKINSPASYDRLIKYFATNRDNTFSHPDHTFSHRDHTFSHRDHTFSNPSDRSFSTSSESESSSKYSPLNLYPLGNPSGNG